LISLAAQLLDSAAHANDFTSKNPKPKTKNQKPKTDSAHVEVENHAFYFFYTFPIKPTMNIHVQPYMTVKHAFLLLFCDF